MLLEDGCISLSINTQYTYPLCSAAGIHLQTPHVSTLSCARHVHLHLFALQQRRHCMDSCTCELPCPRLAACSRPVESSLQSISVAGTCMASLDDVAKPVTIANLFQLSHISHSSSPSSAYIHTKRCRPPCKTSAVDPRNTVSLCRSRLVLGVIIGSPWEIL